MLNLRGRLLHLFKRPGLVTPGRYPNQEWCLKVRTSQYFTVISLGGLDWYFHRESGKFDGTGFHLKAKDDEGN